MLAPIKGVYMFHFIIKAYSKILTILVLSLSFGSLAFAEHNMTHADAYEMAIEAHEKGDGDTSINYLLLAEKLGNNDAYDRLCWICEHDSDNNLTKEWCNQNNCHPGQ